jgi:ABC-2 type transport system ATP-binding protein
MLPPRCASGCGLQGGHVMTNSTPTIEVEGISKHYGQHVAVDNLSFDVRQGEIFSMLGPNGAGKTTTLRMILDIIKPDSGTIRVLGAPFTEQTKERLGYLPEERGLYRTHGSWSF